MVVCIMQLQLLGLKVNLVLIRTFNNIKYVFLEQFEDIESDCYFIKAFNLDEQRFETVKISKYAYKKMVDFNIDKKVILFRN